MLAQRAPQSPRAEAVNQPNGFSSGEQSLVDEAIGFFDRVLDAEADEVELGLGFRRFGHVVARARPLARSALASHAFDEGEVGGGHLHLLRAGADGHLVARDLADFPLDSERPVPDLVADDEGPLRGGEGASTLLERTSELGSDPVGAKLLALLHIERAYGFELVGYLRPHLSFERFDLVAVGLGELRALAFRLVQSLLHLGKLRIERFVLVAEVVARCEHFVGAMLQFADEAVHVAVATAEFLARGRDDRGREPDALGGLDRAAASRDAGDEPERRQSRFDVELHRGVLDAGVGEREALERADVRGDDERAAGLEKVLDDRGGERGPLLGVRAGAELVDERERALRRELHDRLEAEQIGRVGRAVLEHVLVVSDQHAEPVDDRNDRSLGRGHGEARHRHRDDEPRSLERDGLAARVRPTDQQRRAASPERERRRHDHGAARAIAERRLPQLGEAMVE